LVCAYGGW